MTAQHTAGPWAFEWDENGGYDCITGAWIVTAQDRMQGILAIDCENDGDTEFRANAARIVACVNACEGMEDPQAAIEGYKRIAGGRASINAALVESLRTERDALRTAAQSALALLTDGDAEPEDADRVTAELRTVLAK
jgi:hypothetical protein